MKRILAQVKKELTQLWRDRLTLALALVLPVLLLLLLSKATSLSVRPSFCEFSAVCCQSPDSRASISW